MTIGIIGAGHIGQAVVRRLSSAGGQDDWRLRVFLMQTQSKHRSADPSAVAGRPSGQFTVGELFGWPDCSDRKAFGEEPV